MKKSISFVLVAFLILLGLAKTDVISGQNVTKESSYSHWGNWDQIVPLYLDDAGQPVAVWVVTDWHCICHYEYNTGGWFDQIWMLMRWRGDFTYNGIVYEINDKCTYGKHLGKNWNDPAYYNIEFNSNVKGSDGSHLIVSGVFIMFDENWQWVGKMQYDKIVSN